MSTINREDALKAIEAHEIERPGFNLNDYEYGYNSGLSAAYYEIDDLPEADTMDELIRRQVLDLWNRFRPYIATRACEFDFKLRELLSTPPKLEQNTPPEQGESDKLGVKMGETCTDTISRQASISAVYNSCGTGTAVKALKALPSAQPEPIRINLNEYIKVRLTDLGKEIYYHQYDRLNQSVGREICKPRFPKEDENGYTEFQLWCFIELYGMHMGMTLPNVIEPLEIVYERGAE